MKILILSQHFWPEAFRINELASELAAAGCQVEALTGQPNYPEGNIFNNYNSWKISRDMLGPVTIHRVPLIPRGEGSAIRLLLNYVSFIFFGLIIAPFLLAGRKYDVIFVYGTSPILQALVGVMLKWLKRCVLVVWIQDLWPESLSATGFVKSGWILSCVGVLVNWIYHRSDLLLVQSEAFIGAVKERAGNTTVKYYPNSSYSMEHKHVADKTVDIPGVFRVLFAGNLGTAQALETILDAAELLLAIPEISIIIVGSGGRGTWFAEQRERRNLSNVHLLGRFAPKAMPGLFSQASALLVTLAKSPIFSLTVPSKVQSYLSAGKPIIASMNGEGARILDIAQAGLTCAAEDAVALANAISRVYSLSADERDMLGSNALRYFQDHYEMRSQCKVLISHFKSAVRQKNRRLNQ